MSQVIIENPVINSPFEEPRRHFRFAENGITDEIEPGRRRSTYFIPIAQPKLKGAQKQGALDLNVQHRAEENKLINDLRERVAHWRQAGRPYTTAMTRRLLDYWTRPDRERRLFFCQVEAVETLIYLTEIAPRHDANHGTFILERFKQANAQATPDSHAMLPRYAAKMATGSGKTVVMGMLIAWQALNKLANRQDQRFSDAFLMVSPGITIRDRLRVLLPNDPNNYYRQLDLLPPSLRDELGKAKVAIINYHAFIRRERNSAASLTKKLLTVSGEASPFQESAGQMVARVCVELGNKKNIVVLNDEAHHCYHRRPVDGDEKLSGDELLEAKQREEEAKIWIGGLGAVQKKLGVRAVYDLSATPFFLRGSGYPEGTLFPWVTSDFSLTDAIESGIVKVPRVPVADNTGQGENPTYRHLWAHIGKDMPKGRGSKEEGPLEPVLPKELQGALHSLYSHYEKAYQQWQEQVKEYPAHDAADRIYQAIVAADSGASTLKPILQPYNTVGDTRGVSFNTSRATWQTNHKCPISHVVLDSGWEGKMAQALEYMDEAYSYVKNHNLDFRIPYTFEGQPHSYLPDFIVRVNDIHGKDDLLNLIIEVSGPPLPAKAAKTATIQNLWVPAVNNAGQFGRWAFVEVKDPESAMQTVREYLNSRVPSAP